MEYVPLLHRVEVGVALRQAQGGHGELVEPFPLPFTLLDMVFYSALLSRKRSI